MLFQYRGSGGHDVVGMLLWNRTSCYVSLYQLWMMLHTIHVITANPFANNQVSATTSTSWNTLTMTSASGKARMTQTQSGYDTERGIDPICWRTRGILTPPNSSTDDAVQTSAGYLLKNPLLEGFRVLDTMEMLYACPMGNSLKATAPAEFHAASKKRPEQSPIYTQQQQQNSSSMHAPQKPPKRPVLHTGRVYNYTVSATINVTAFINDYYGDVVGQNEMDAVVPIGVVIADNGTFVAVQVLLCVLGQVGFCSPFVHEQSNARLIAQNLSTYVAPGDRHGDTHVHSGYKLLPLPPEQGPVYHIDEQSIPMKINWPGNFYAIASLQLYVKTSGEVVRYDMANALVEADRLINYQDPPDILTVSRNVRVISYVAIALTAAIILFLLAQTVRHRQHQVLKLTQGPFLMVFLSAALLATMSSVLLEPKNDTYCQWVHPMLLCSLQLQYAITWGRLWRIHSVISPLLLQTIRRRHHQEQITSSSTTRTAWLFSSSRRIMDGIQYIILGRFFHDVFRLATRVTMGQSLRRSRTSGNSGAASLRQEITAWQLALVVAFFTVPQVVLQILTVYIQPPHQVLELNQDETMGRNVCQAVTTDDSFSTSDTRRLFYWDLLATYGYMSFFVMVLWLMLMAQATKNLPSLFNETHVIFESSVSTMVLLVLSGSIHMVMDGPTTSPNVRYMLGNLLVLSSSLNMTLRIMIPKLRMIWRNETVVVSKLVSDNRREADNSSSRRSSSAYFNSTYSNSLCNNNDCGLSQQNGNRNNTSSGHRSSTSRLLVSGVESSCNSLSTDFRCCQGTATETPPSESQQFTEEQVTAEDNADTCVSVTHLDQPLQCQTISPIIPLNAPDKGRTLTIQSSGLLFASIKAPFPDVDKDDKYHAAMEPMAAPRRDSVVRFEDHRPPREDVHRPDHNQRADSEKKMDRPSRRDLARAISREKRQLGPKRPSAAAVEIQPDAVPPRRLVMRMMHLQSQLTYVNERICSGLVVSENDWTTVRKLSKSLVKVFQDDVHFAWENNGDDNNNNNNHDNNLHNKNNNDNNNHHHHHHEEEKEESNQLVDGKQLSVRLDV